MVKKNKKAWIRIIEAFIAILLITGVLLIILNQEYIGKKDISKEIYKIERSILKEIQLDNEFRNDILNTNPPVTWDDTNFPLDIKNKIISRLPSYLNCEAKICAIDEVCILDTVFDRDIYAQSVSIIAQLTQYNPRQLKLFCWVGVAPGVEEPSLPTCLELGGKECESGYYCIENYLSANDTEECCPAGSCAAIPLPEANLTLLFSGTEYELKFNVEIEGLVYLKVYYYYHNRTFEEHNGVGVNLTEGQLCYDSTGNCDSASVNYRIDENSVLIRENEYFYTPSDEDIFTLHYWGIDDNGYDVYINQSMCVQKSQFTENCVP